MQELNKINEITRKSYNLVAAKYHELFKDEMNQKEYDRKLLDDFSKYFSSDSSIYDMGCGPSGHIGKYLRDKGLNVIGIDISEKCIEIASQYNPNMEFLTMDMTNLELEDQSIDGIISFYSIIHTPKKYVNQIFHEFRRVLRKGGKVLITVKEGTGEGYIYDFLGYDTTIYFTHFTRAEIENYFINNAFKLLFLEEREPYEEEIAVSRIYAIGEKI